MSKVTPIKAPASGGGDFEIAPEGVFLARCYKMVDVGTQTSVGQFGTKENRTIYIYWELLQTADGEEVKMENGDQPFSIFSSYTLSMHPKAKLRKHLDSWRGKKFTEDQAKDFDVTQLLDKFCLLQIEHSESKDGTRTYANVVGIMTTKKKVDGVNEISSFNIESPDMEVFNDLPEWLQAKIEDAPEWDDTATENAAPSQPAVKKEDVQVADDEIDVEDVPF